MSLLDGLLGGEAGALLGAADGALRGEPAGGTLVPEPGAGMLELDGVVVELVLLPEEFFAVGELSQAASDSASIATGISHFPFIISSPFGLRFSEGGERFATRFCIANEDASAKIPGPFFLISAINPVLPAWRSVATAGAAIQPRAARLARKMPRKMRAAPAKW